MEVWSGSISTGSFDLRIKFFNSSSKRDNAISSKSKLSLSSFVNPALIPLYARAGPSVEVHTVDVESAEWLKTRLLGSLWLEELDEEHGPIEIQCPVALLLTVEGQQTSNEIYPNTNKNNVSDFLVYGILTAGNQEQQQPPSAPGSSVGENVHHGYETSQRYKRDLRIYAAPLSTSYVQKAQDLPSPPSSPDAEGDDFIKDGFTQFLPDLRSPTPKRKRMLSLFEEAAEHHRRVRQYGGGAVSRMMAKNIQQQQQQSSQPFQIKREPEEPNKPTLDRLRRARSLSIGGSHLARLGENARIGSDESRPSTSKGTQVVRRALSKKDVSHSFHEFERSRSIAPTPDPADPAAFDQTSSLTHGQLSSPPKTGETLIAINKDLITRTILTGMRLYGYHRKSSRPAKPSTSIATGLNYELDGIEESGTTTAVGNPMEDSRQSGAGVTVPTDEDDFKAMYHATYKAATFALRHYLKISQNTDNGETIQKSSGPVVLSKDTATNVIDGILRLFCDDQLKPPG